ncbi:AAA family ATPase [Cohnella lupini]|uniref:Cellulose biosynthesis protein BcsQ n=1 Tax=Cohnella lupini TaxID=1294267 RepID=A0A3D9IML5_9BACL|nr:AAA family ATPase [Cohnella lupini]RED63024.1 cellulose biosynthesis protein BcsQ [Cohnella lupini]
MERLTVVLAGPDTEYLEMVLRFVRSSEFASALTIRAFSSKDNLATYLNTQSIPHVVLVEPDFLTADVSWTTLDNVILLVSSQYSKESERYPSLFKYQPIHQLLTKAKAMYLDKHEVVVEQALGNGHTKVVSFYSIVGGCGKTTAAINMSRQLSLGGNKVLYLSLETVSSSPAWFGTVPNQELAEILYYITSGNKQAASKLEQYRKTDSESGLHYLEPLTHLKEIEDVSREDVRGLLDIIVSSHSYDYVVIDCDSNFHARTIAALEYAHEVMLLLLDDIQCMYKTKAALTALRSENAELYQALHRKIHMVVNKYTGSMANRPEPDLFDIQGYLPYIPQWKNVTQGQQLSASREFNHQAMFLTSLFSQAK